MSLQGGRGGKQRARGSAVLKKPAGEKACPPCPCPYSTHFHPAPTHLVALERRPLLLLPVAAAAPSRLGLGPLGGRDEEERERRGERDRADEPEDGEWGAEELRTCL